MTSIQSLRTDPERRAKVFWLLVRLAMVLAGGLLFWLAGGPWQGIGWLLFLWASAWDLVKQQTQPWRDERRRRLHPDHGRPRAR